MHIVMSASRWADIRPALKDQIGTRIELRLGDPTDSELDVGGLSKSPMISRVEGCPTMGSTW